MIRPQFSLRTLLIFVTILAVPCWYVGAQARIVTHRKAMLEKLSKMGGDWWDFTLEKTPPLEVPWVRSWFGDRPVYQINWPAHADPSVQSEILEAFPEVLNQEHYGFQ